MTSELTEMNETVEHKILSYCFSTDNEACSQKEFTSNVEKRFGKSAKKTAIELWKKGCFHFNVNGYVNLTNRGCIFWQKGKLPPKRKPKPKLTTADYLNYFWNKNREEFEEWLLSKGKISI